MLLSFSILLAYKGGLITYIYPLSPWFKQTTIVIKWNETKRRKEKVVTLRMNQGSFKTVEDYAKGKGLSVRPT